MASTKSKTLLQIAKKAPLPNWNASDLDQPLRLLQRDHIIEKINTAAASK